MEKLDALHWVLAFAGALIHILLKVQEMSNGGYLLATYLKKNWAHIVASAIMIPVILVVLSETTLGDVLPINHLTALLAGYQTNSIFKTLIGLGKSKYVKTDEVAEVDNT